MEGSCAFLVIRALFICISLSEALVRTLIFASAIKCTRRGSRIILKIHIGIKAPFPSALGSRANASSPWLFLSHRDETCLRDVTDMIHVHRTLL